MRNSLFPLVLAVLCLLVATPAAPRTWVVPDDAPTIQAGIDSSTAMDTILVRSGTYYECYIEPRSHTVLISETGEASCVTIDAQRIRNAIRCFDLDSTTVIQGFTLKNGGNISLGGGLYADNSDPRIINCTIRNCRADQYGGGIYLENSSPYLENCMFYADTATVDGGGIYTAGTSSPFLYDCIFTGDFAYNYGGGICATGGSSPGFQVCTIESNRAVAGGAGAFISAAGADFTFCYFRSNLIAAGNGCAMACNNSSTVTLTACTFDRHFAADYGGAIYSLSSDLEIDGCTFHINGAGTGGGAIYTSGSTVDVENTIIAFGQSGGAVGCFGAPPAISCSDIFGNVGGDWTGCIAGQSGVNGNFSEDPRFCSRETVNFTLRSCSPCIDASGCGRVGAYGQGYCPRVWNVPAYAPTIQAGIDSACGGDTVLVACDTYYENDIEMKSGVTLIGDTDPGTEPCVTIDAGTLGKVMACLSLPDTVRIQGFVMTGGSSDYGGALRVLNSVALIDHCHFLYNYAATYGGGAHFSSFASVVTNCVFSDNVSGYYAGGAYLNGSNTEFRNCVFHNNSGLGGGLYCYNSQPVVENSIVSYNNYRGIVCNIPISQSLTCCNVYGNNGGDYIGCISGQDTLNGNISAKPRFCDAGNHVFTLSSASECLYQPCGLIGAYGRGCWDEIPYISMVSDVGNDQGRQARLTWERSGYDAGGDTVDVTGYGVYRRQDAHLEAMKKGSESTLRDGRLSSAPLAQGWDYVGGVPARGDSIYQFVAPTLCDSTDDGICWSVFMVSAETADPLTYFDSDPDSGYSIDNLAPAPPPGLTMPSATALAWEEVPDADFDYYSVYGSLQDHLDGTATLIGYTIDTGKDITGHVYDYYHVTAADFSGNEGEESSVNNVFAAVPGLPGQDDIPTAFALKRNRPNPFSTTTVIAFDLPEDTNARITIYDTHGRLIKRLTDSSYEAGRHAVTWAGEDDRGNKAAPGVYFVRMETGAFEDMKKVMLLR